MIGKFCLARSKESKAITKIFLFSEEGWGDTALFIGLAVDENPSIHLDYLLHNLTQEALKDNVPVARVRQLADEACLDLGGTFELEPLIRIFSGERVSIEVDEERDDYWSMEESSSSEEY